MSYDTSDIKHAIKEYYMREIEDNNLVHKGRASRINSLHHWKENDLKYFEELESKAGTFDAVLEIFEDEYIDKNDENKARNFGLSIRDLIAEYESEAD